MPSCGCGWALLLDVLLFLFLLHCVAVVAVSGDNTIAPHNGSAQRMDYFRNVQERSQGPIQGVLSLIKEETGRQVLEEPLRPGELLMAAGRCYGDCFELERVGPESTGCPRSCRFLNQAAKEFREQAAGLYTWVEPVLRARPGQLLFGYWQESPQNHKDVQNESTMSLFNYSSSYRRDSDHVRGYDGLPGLYNIFYQMLANGTAPDPLPYSVKKGADAIATTMITNKRFEPNKRTPIIAALEASGVSVLNYASWTYKGPEILGEDDNSDIALMSRRFSIYQKNNVLKFGSRRYSRKIAAISRHLFHFAFENSDCKDYHTEKALHALLAGTVPVYLGHPSVRHFLPRGSYIAVRDFNSIGELAAQLHRIANNQTLYEEYFEWRQRPMDEWVKAFAWRGSWEHVAHQYCKMCKLLHEPAPSTLRPDTDCLPPYPET